MMIRFLFFTVLLLCFNLSGFAQSVTYAHDSPGKLRVVTTDFPPYSYSINLRVTGLATDVVRAAFEQADIAFPEPEICPWARAYQLSLSRPDTLIYSIARTPEREDKFIWIGTVAPYQIKLYKLRHREDISINTLDDAKRFIIGGEIDDVKQAYLKKQGFVEGDNLRLVADDELNLRMLFAGRIDLLPFNAYSLPLVAKKLDLDVRELEAVLSLKDISYDLYMALSRNSSDTLSQSLIKAYKQISANGTLSLIRQRYLAETVAMRP